MTTDTKLQMPDLMCLSSKTGQLSALRTIRASAVSHWKELNKRKELISGEILKMQALHTVPGRNHYINTA